MFLKEHITVISPQNLGIKLYDSVIFISAFAKSQAIYDRRLDNFKLPNVRTLSESTSKVKNLDGYNFLRDVFNNIFENQKSGFVSLMKFISKLHYSIYFNLFGFAENSMGLTKTILGIMVKYLNGVGNQTFCLR